ncbi:MAG: DNA polymerase III subunit delta' [Rhodospirillales bacterium]|jgi:DNA polymerase III subunit delta'|nr:DNA polymerase III subunit delta' [Rhodospirillales bacterium]MBT5077242.1 DNA polymerase III subunit delta' [Rhodospirillales bacterium]MBT5112794.1 DNA polymerase III subunit delta' [Rhodospirillales bacterium]MBT5673564.1 DNA polymerase III subunit delta' [Rhodospirillales bacterium]MBT6186223.1 DNA polymerase III subunit delta' [Rhodospirillales bacterium]
MAKRPKKEVPDVDDTPLYPDPRNNPDLIGFEAIERQIADTVEAGRIHHAWLISGPKGIGKATLAYRFARHLLAQTGAGMEMAGAQGASGAAGAGDPNEGMSLFGELPTETTEAANVAEAEPDSGFEKAGGDLWLDPATTLFRRIAANGHADFMTVERGYDEKTKKRRTAIIIDDIRRVSDFLSLTAAEGGWRVVIVDGAEDMNRNAANALLKTLEEPPKKVILLLISHAPGRLLPTIRSRCRKLALNPLDDAHVVELIGRYRPDISNSDAQLLGTIAEGSIGRALQLADAGGVALYGELVNLLSGLPDLDGPRLHTATELIARTRGESGGFEAFDVFTDLLGWWITQLVRMRAVGSPPQGLVSGEAEIMARLGATGSLDQWVEVWEKITHLFSRAGAVNLDRKQVLLNAFFAISKIA